MLRQPRGDTSVQELYRILTSAVAFLLGNSIEVSASATTAVQSVRHGLNRVYRGGWVTSGPNQALYLRVLAPPEGQAEPETYVYFQLSAATACTARVWVF